MINIESYRGVNNFLFGSKQDVVVSSFGLPCDTSLNLEGEAEIHFDGFILRFDSSSKVFRECTILPGCAVKINGFDVEWLNGFLDWLSIEDDDLKEVFGFVVSLKLGLAVTGFHDDGDSQKAIHAFSSGDWDGFSADMKDFKWK